MKGFIKLPAILLFILAFATVLDLFLFPGRSITFDGHIHITTFAQFARALADGEFPVRWSDGFANYGHPLPLFAHQTTSYLGGTLTLLFGSPLLAYNFLFLAAAFLSSWLFYRFLLKVVRPEAALLGAALFTLAPYRLVNIFVRGALPEFFALIFIPWLLLGIFQVIKERRWIGFVNVLLATALLAFTHPMLLILTALLAVPFTLFWGWPWKKNWKPIMGLGLIAVVAVGSTAAYIVPLLHDIRFTNYGTAGPQFSGNFLSFAQLWTENWGYFGIDHPGPRPETLVPGIPELLLLLSGAILSWREKKSMRRFSLLLFTLGCVALFLLLPLSAVLYRVVPFLGNVQFPWRMLSAFLFIPPLILALWANKRPFFWPATILVIALILWRIPQAYGKNYLSYDEQHFFFTRANLHTNNLSTLWMGDPTTYSSQAERFQIVAGEGVIESAERKNASRRFLVQAQTPLQVVEYTFYFPGWTASIDGTEVPIQFQDPNYRGLISFEVPAGEHQIVLQFKETKIRLVAWAVSLVSVVCAAVLLGLEGKYHWLAKKD